MTVDCQSRLVYKATTIKWGFLKNDYSLLFLFRLYSPCKINLVYYNNKNLKTPSPQSKSIKDCLLCAQTIPLSFDRKRSKGCNPASLVWTRPLVVDYVFDDKKDVSTTVNRRYNTLLRYVALQHDMFHFVQRDIYSLCSYSI